MALEHTSVSALTTSLSILRQVSYVTPVLASDTLLTALRQTSRLSTVSSVSRTLNLVFPLLFIINFFHLML